VVGNTIVGRADSGQTLTLPFRLLQGGQMLEIGSDQYLRQ
jgi:hypothetical protein